MNSNRYRTMGAILLVMAAGIIQGCATNISGPSAAPAASTVKFSTFRNATLAPVTIDPKYADSGANQKAQAKIQELLTTNLGYIFPGLRTAPESSSNAVLPGTLRIEPNIDQIKFVGGAKRFWFGAMAGSSAVLMTVNYRDLGSNTIVAHGQFFANAGAFAGAYSYGGADNAMLNTIVQNICDYAKNNR